MNQVKRIFKSWEPSLFNFLMFVSFQEHKSKYIFLLAYASSVCDTWSMKKGNRKTLNKDEVWVVNSFIQEFT